ncbi:MAG: amidohydrolase [Bacteroidales bacterium]|nr:amidohydrolase [Bacteroidales bacterium]
MKVVILQQDIVRANPSANLSKLDAMLRDVLEVDLVVLPEMFTTGFETDMSRLAESMDGPTVRWMRELALHRQCAVCGSLVVREDGKCFNRMVWVDRNAGVSIYDKRHLFSYAAEEKTFSAGRNRVVVESGGVRLLLQVCYDLRFPVWSRNAGDYDVAVYVANWPESRQQAWNVLLKARALENQCYVIGVNRVGEDGRCKYVGGSVVVNPYGEVIARCQDGMEMWRSSEIDMDMLATFRSKFPVLKDRDMWMIEN